ncbi:hypothetical protein ABFX02_04G113100 [Erythranthe guttata]
MVQLMKTADAEPEPQTEKTAAAAVKTEEVVVEDSLEEQHGPLYKRPKSLEIGGFTVPPSQYNPLAEPSPLGLRLRKSPSLLELIQLKLSQSTSPKSGAHTKKDSKAGASSSVDKLKASNFPGSVLRIGNWEYKSRYEGDLVAKCYFAKHKLVWEVLDGGLKNKIEIQWSDIMALKATYLDDSPGTLHVVLARQPLFFRETNPQPRKHTLWQATSDFTDGQATLHRQHYLECPQGLLGKHFEKLMQCDPRLSFLSQQGEIALDSPYFETGISGYDNQNENNNELDLNREGSPSFFSLQDTASPSGAQSSSSKNDLDAFGRRSESYPRETPSPISVMDASTVEYMKTGRTEQLKWDQIKVPGTHSSMSMTDLVNHLEHRISEQGISASSSQNPILSSDEWQSLQILDDIQRCLFTENNNNINNGQHSPDSDEKSLMSRVNSLCCLLQKDKDNDNVKREEDENRGDVNEVSSSSMSRKDSAGDLLLNLPRIASLPQFLFNISEDYENRAR